MKKLLIVTGIIGTAAAGVFLYMRNRNQTSKSMHELADKAGDIHEGARKYFRKAGRQAKRDFEDAIA